MNISEIWMRLEALTHLRGMPQLAALRQKIESELAAHNADLGAKPVPPADEQSIEEAN